LWRGLVYPSRDDDAIDAAGPAFTPADCAADNEARTEAIRQFLLTAGEGEAYVLVAGPAAARVSALSALRALGVDVIRSGPYLGDDIDGFAADWFIRVVAEPDARAAIETALAGALLAEPVKSPGANEIQTQILRIELARAHQRIEAQTAEVTRLRTALDGLARTAADGSALLDKIEEDHRAAIEEERRARHLAEYAAQALIEDSPAPDFEEAAEPADERAPVARSKISDEIDQVLRAFLPRIRLLRDSLTVIASEFSSRGGVYRGLKELEATTAGMPINWKKLKGQDQWWERHVPTGSDNAGRAYARLDPHERTWSVLISHKLQQTRDIKWLATQ
jgi:hypothetical protein